MSNTKQQIEEIRVKAPACKHCGAVDFVSLDDKAVEAINRLVTEAYRKGFNTGSGKRPINHDEILKIILSNSRQTKEVTQLNNTTLKDVVSGTPEGQDAVKEAMRKPAKDMEAVRLESQLTNKENK